MKSTKQILIIANGNLLESSKLTNILDLDPFLICCDGGADNLLTYNIEPDLIIGDIDGVVVVPFNQIDDITSKLQNIIKVENEMDKKVQEGLKISPKIQDLINSDKVKYYD